jgi:hypothetical protein
MNERQRATDIQRRLSACTIVNDYDGFDEYLAFAKHSPETAVAIGWSVLTGSGDPGQDDHALCVDLMKALNKVGGQEAIEQLILANWASLSDPIRFNIVIGAGAPKVVSTKLGLKLFFHPATRTEQRHLIAAGFASNRPDDISPQTILDLVRQIGHYDENARQAVLNSFVTSAVAGLTKECLERCLG